MNRRLVLVDSKETSDYLKLCTGDFNSCEIYVREFELNPTDIPLGLESGDAVMIVGGKPFAWLRQYYHFGIRGENYFDCSKLRRLSIEGGAYVKCITVGTKTIVQGGVECEIGVVDYPEPDVIQDFLSPEFSKDADFSWFKQKILHTYEEAVRMINYFDSLPLETDYGFDYEASGMPLDPWFEISGASICTTQFGGFISFTDIRHSSTPDLYNDLLHRLGQFLVKRQDHVWTYNMQYEFQVSHRMLGVDLYNLRDASVVNVLDGDHMKKYSLKWTANKVLQSKVWDTEFDRISDLVDSMLFEEVGKLKRDKKKILKVDKDNFKNTPEWNELCMRYPNYAGEFEALILEYWGNPFMCIPSDILGFYCNLDSFYTLMIYKQKSQTYTQQAFDVFTDNIRLQCRLHSCGINKDEEFRSEYEVYCKRMMAWGITYCAEARCKIKMDKHQKEMADPKKYHPVALKLIKEGNFSGGNMVEVAKFLLSTNIDTLDTTPLGLNEGSMMLKYGQEFTEQFINILEQAMRDSGMIKDKTDKKTKAVTTVITKIDDGVVRKKKLLGLVGDALNSYFNVPALKVDSKKHQELEKYYYYEKAYKELMKITKNQLGDINNIPDTFHAFGQVMDSIDYSSFISDNYFKCKSPIENDLMCVEFMQLYPCESSFLSAILESTLQLDGDKSFYSKRNISTIEEAFEHFMAGWENYCNSDGQELGDYPEKVYNLASDNYARIIKGKLIKEDPLKEIWANFNGFNAQEQFFKYVDNQVEDYSKVFNELDLSDNFFFMRKFVLNYLLYKKYSKVLTTYIGTYDKDKGQSVGMFLGDDKWVIENPQNHIMIRDANPDEPGAVCKMTTRFAALEKSSKRWSSGYHTIISHSDIKSTIASYPGCLVTYFDISSAEVKSAGFQSGDPSLIDKFVNGIDIEY